MSSQLTALVTGGAARIGEAIVRALHQRGCNVVLHYNASESPARAVAESLNATRPDSVVTTAADLSSPQGVSSLAQATNEALAQWGGGLSVLVNNASRFYPTTVGDTQAYEWDDLVNSNLRGPYFLVQSLLEPLRAASGSVVNILDVHAERPMQGHAVYSASKAGLRMMTLALARELAPGIRVNGVSPGAILWPEREVSESAKAEVLSRVALERLGAPEDISSAVAYLALDAPYVTGQILAVDGGRSLNI